MEQIIVRYIDLPYETKGVVRRDNEGDYNVYINARLSWLMQSEVLWHELKHISESDLDNDKTLEEVEGM